MPIYNQIAKELNPLQFTKKHTISELYFLTYNKNIVKFKIRKVLYLCKIKLKILFC